MKLKALFLGSIKLIKKKTPARLIRTRREKILLRKIRNEGGGIATDSADIKRIIRNCYARLYAYEFNNLDKMIKFFERHGPPKLTQEIDTLNILISSKEIKIQQRKLQVQMFSLLNSTKHLRKSTQTLEILKKRMYFPTYFMTKLQNIDENILNPLAS